MPPEQLLRATLLQMFYTVRSERILVEQLDYNLLFRWFVDLAMDDPVARLLKIELRRHPVLRTGVADFSFPA